jgi:hypothetical protein
MGVIRAGKRGNPNQAVGSGAIFNDDRLLPSIGKSFAEYPSGAVRGAARAHRYDHTNHSLWPRVPR